MAGPFLDGNSKPNIRSSGPELLIDLAAQLGEILYRNNIRPETILPITDELIDTMARHWGGQQFYFPMGIQIQRDRRNAEIWRRFRGSNYATLARDFGMSIQAVYRIHRDEKQRRKR